MLCFVSVHVTTVVLYIDDRCLRASRGWDGAFVRAAPSQLPPPPPRIPLVIRIQNPAGYSSAHYLRGAVGISVDDRPAREVMAPG